MLSDVHNKAIEELYSTPIVQQTAFWSEVKNKLGIDTLAVNFKSRLSGLYHSFEKDQLIASDMLVILQQIDRNHSVAYIPYGPELEPNEEFQGVFLEELSECVRSFLPKNCILIRYDLCWESYWAKNRDHFDQNGFWKGEPEFSAQEFRFNFNTVNWNFKRSYSNILPSNTIFLDLKPSLESILLRMKPKTRYNIGLAKRKNIIVYETGIDDISLWYELYKETALRNRILLNDFKYFQAVLSAKVDDSRSPTDVRLLIAKYGTKPLAAMFLVMTGNRGSYLYGASSTENRNLMATYALQWEAIRISKINGCTEYDMFGISPTPDPYHPLYGLYVFKSGFGGNIFHSMGCWDYPLDEEKYTMFQATELKSAKFHLS